MSDVFETANQLKKELNDTNEVKEYLRLLECIKKDSNLTSLIKQIQEAEKINDKNKVQKLKDEYLSSPIVKNFESSKENLLDLLNEITTIINKNK